MSNLKGTLRGVPEGTQYLRDTGDGYVMYYRVNSEGVVEFHCGEWSTSQFESIDELKEFTNIQSKEGFNGH
jgi:putative component of toxin-antitoxin plasmid stabilization module